MILIIGIFVRDSYKKKEIYFASDGLAVKYKDNKKIAQDEDVEKIRKLTPKMCIGYTGKNAELFEDVYRELKDNTSIRMKKEIKPFAGRLQEVILKMLNTKKHKEIEKELEKHEQVLHKFIVVGQFLGAVTLIRLNSDDKYRISIEEVYLTPSGYTCYVAGSTEEIQNKTWAILERKLALIRNNNEIESIIRNTISEIAERYPNEINNHVFIRRLSRNFDS